MVATNTSCATPGVPLIGGFSARAATYREISRTHAVAASDGEKLTRSAVLPGAFADSVDLARDGVINIELLVDHDRRRPLASTGDGSMVLFDGERGLSFRLSDTPRGRGAYQFLRRHPEFGQCSVGAITVESDTVLCPQRGPCVFLKTGVLCEISIVEQGGCPVTWVRTDGPVLPGLAADPISPRLHDGLGAWAIDTSATDRVLTGVRGRGVLARCAAFELDDDEFDAGPPVTLATGRGGRLIAVVSLSGALSKGRSFYGGTSTIRARQAVDAAAANPDVSGILLSIDSPGGTVAGTDELGQAVRQARRRKPVFAQINDTGASAAYWVASQASKVYANSPTALVGSIGTMLAVRKDTSGELAVFTSGPLKAPGSAGELSDGERGYLQSLVSGMQESFDEAVKRGRRMTDAEFERVRSGAVFLAPVARDLKLIDGIQGEDATLAELAATR